mmetsp:Transcript_27530/g.72387  ORF Transcript_27530/g.72387 Transcript_27530/m.72387 type:complete len:193 (+) Transcript_27530:67-645(+)|eukprot:CAMPEP_0182925210 /NCGR_PEP_ID=MMETSP0105_2-20130417/8573_1 /TAXON_ID=81532 ORGANISM="Acanthoeca-like sp., Strain 10tr" /NCGR_SAMPLE_ID=MMETSP0105_2 /ASSEMBLY_ACC=CAM_ASM_000205 /LENGTH=192 /DNA_ID=CAMNT_0025063047 /DNA_START=66 /DNA_END=644 /DNA_ORIENTATION=-
MDGDAGADLARSRPATSKSEKAAEEQSAAVMARVMSATNKRINRLVSAGSRPSTRGASASEELIGDGDAAAWTAVDKIVTDVCRGWPLSDGWKFCVKRVGQLETKFLLEAVFSIPTRRRPVPNATASVLFAVDVDGGEAGAAVRETLFSVETQDLIHSAAHDGFSEQWLYDVLAAKRLTHDLADDILGPGPA